jgi:hypothetical protein
MGTSLNTLISPVSSFFLALTVWLAYTNKAPSNSRVQTTEGAASAKRKKPDNRQKLINNVRTAWIEGVLEKAP